VQRTDPRWLEDNGRFIPYPATWLNGRRWEDVTIEPNPHPPRAPDPGLQWFEECEVLHRRDCGLSKSAHDARMCRDRDRAKTKAARPEIAGERISEHADLEVLSDATG
jgi:hypothetical protein